MFPTLDPKTLHQMDPPELRFHPSQDESFEVSGPHSEHGCRDRADVERIQPTDQMAFSWLNHLMNQEN